MTTNKSMNQHEATLEHFRDRLEHWLIAYDLHGDSTMYSQDQWNARKETAVHADGFLLHITSEGPLCHLCNYGYETDQDTLLLSKFAEHHGWVVEQGYSWSWHFMPISQFDAEPSN